MRPLSPPPEITLANDGERPNLSATMKKLFAVVASLFVAVAAYAGEFPDISVKEVKALVASKKAVLVDVNGTQSWKKGHIPGALNFDAVEKEFAKSLPEDKSTLIVAYCGGPRCSAYKAAAEAAEKLGYKNVKHMSAGISGWTGAGEKTEAGK
jgi:rhodanese-related sulfurtransferase